MYIAETAHPSARASLSSIPGFYSILGVCSLWILGYFFTWRNIAYLSTIPLFLTFIIFSILPETPYWLIENGKEMEAKASLKFFRGSVPDIGDELHDIKLKYLEKQAKKQNGGKNVLNVLISKSFLKPFSCIGILRPLYVFSGVWVVTNYLTEWIKYSEIPLEPTLCSLILGIAR